MHLSRALFMAAATILAAIGVVGAAVASRTGSTSTAHAQAPGTTTVVVTAGKPTEYAFKLSKTSLIPAGTVTFQVTNRGTVPHSFKVCSRPSGGTVTSCVGKATKVLQPGQSATLTVTLAKGKYEYLSGVAGEAGAGMNGVVGVGVAASAPALPKTTVTVTAGKPSELAFTLSKFSQLPAGAITFKVKNAGAATHDFKLCTITASSSAKNSCVGVVTKLLKSGESTAMTVVLLKKGKYEYLCTVPGHAAAGMKGLLGIGVKVAAPGGSTTGPPATTTTPGTPPPPPPPPPAGGGGGGGGGGGDAECPPGVTIQTSGNGDQDNDELGGPSDGDGCV
jgi:uncharacterized cupredoxin-like copper-binding protein